MESHESIVYRLLPELIQRRVQKIPSLRRSMSWTAKTTALYDPIEPLTTSRPSSSNSNASMTPPPSYRSSRIFPRYDSPSDATISDTRHSRNVSITYGATDGGQTEQSGSGIDWKYADQGMRLLDNSLQESYSATATQWSQAFSRQLYIHSCTYLLRALPHDMTTEEAISIQNAMPQTIKDDLARQPSTSELVARQSADEATRAADRSTLHRFVAFLILQFFLVVNILLPYIKLLLGVVYRFERKHRISERVFSVSVQSVDVMGKRGLELSRQIASMNNGQVGQAANEVMVWWIRGVTGGIHEGIGEGLSLVNANGRPADRRSIVRDVREIT